MVSNGFKPMVNLHPYTAGLQERIDEFERLWEKDSKCQQMTVVQEKRSRHAKKDSSADKVWAVQLCKLATPA